MSILGTLASYEKGKNPSARLYGFVLLYSIFLPYRLCEDMSRNIL